jgi:uncharacterized protein YqjF (DUF2071 family)
MVQQWQDLAYIHWRYPIEEIQALLPAGVEVDSFDGSAWVGLIPFSMKNIGLPRMPAVPYFGSFPEVNVRTYVRRNGVPGVWFFSLDVNRFLPALVARVSYFLPYCWGKASNKRTDSNLETEVRRRWPSRASTSIRVSIGDPIESPDELSVFLSARWGLYSRGIGKGVRYAPVAGHRPLPATEYMTNNRDISVWLVPVEGSRTLIPYRIQVKTQIGNLLIDAQSISGLAVDATASIKR